MRLCLFKYLFYYMKKIFIIVLLSMFGMIKANAQDCLERPEPLLYSNDTSVCLGNSVTLEANINTAYPVGIGSISTQTLTDDAYSGVINIGFNFVFYGVTYSQCIISSNNYISFVLGNAGGYSAWAIPGPAPSASTPQLSIMCPWQDVNPGVGGQIRYQTIGVAPNRIFVVEFCNIPMFSCTGQLFTDQILLYEGCNIIETHIVSKTLCTSWNDGKAIHGLSKNATTAHIVPGRNAPGHWTATMDGYRFTPNPSDPNDYILEPIPYNPYLLGLDPSFITWYKGSTATPPIGTGTSITDFPTEPTTYIVEIAAGGTCNGVVKQYPIIVDFNSNFYDTVTAEICSGELYDHYGDIYYEAGIYTKHITYENSCDTFKTVILTVNPTPDASIEADKTSFCEGDQATIIATKPSTAQYFQWYHNDTPIPDATTSSIFATEPGTYRVVMSTIKGCVDTSRQITISVYPPAEVDIASVEADFDKICIGDTIEISVNNPQPNYEYRWTPEKYFRYLDGGRLGSVRAKIDEPTFLHVMARNIYGCLAYDSIFVNPVPCCDVYLPTAFSPNNDGLNDNFNILLQPGQKIVSFQIFDRFGNMMYDNNDPARGWNGKVKNTGKDAGQGVYYYRVVYSCTDKENYEVKGDVTLVN